RNLPPPQYIPDHNFDTHHIALDLRFDWEKQQLLGSETIVFAPLVPNLKAISLDAANITPTSIKLTANRLQPLSAPQVLQSPVQADKERLNVSLDRSYQPAAELTLTIDYHTNGP